MGIKICHVLYHMADKKPTGRQYEALMSGKKLPLLRSHQYVLLYFHIAALRCLIARN